MTGRIAAACVAILLGLPSAARSQDPMKDAPPAVDDFEADADGDGVPDRWYNLRDVKLVTDDGAVGPKFFRFEQSRPGRPARVSRGFTIDGKQTEALIVGIWVRVEGIHAGDRTGEDPCVQVDFFGERLVPTGRERLGPFTDRLGRGWVHVSRRIRVPATTQGAILTMGLIGAVGRMDVDGLTIEKVPAGGATTTNLILNGDCELGVDSPNFWALEGTARRVHPGRGGSKSAVELPSSLDKALLGVAVRADKLREVVVRASVKASGLRGGGGAKATLYFLDADGRPLAGPDESEPLWNWSGSFAWKAEEVGVRVPAFADRAVIQFERTSGNGSLTIDDVQVFENATAPLTWTPFHAKTDTEGWKPFAGAPAIEPKSALDASFLLESPAGRRGPVVVREGRLHFADGSRARFFGVALLPPLAFPEAAEADAMADRLARSGVNLVKFDGLDAAFGPGRSLYDDSRDDTQGLDPDALARFDHLVAALKSRGIYVAIELQNLRRFREEDNVPGGIALPPGGGPAAAFDPTIRKLLLRTAELLLLRKNAETGLTLCEDPALAWVTITGELSLFDLLDDGQELPPESSAELKALIQKGAIGTGRTAWRQIEASQWKGVADGLRKLGLKRPIAGSSHWRREADFAAAQAAAGLDLIEDRLYWAPPRFGVPERRSMLWKPSASLSQEAQRKRKTDRPYVVGDFASHTAGAWSLPYEGADFLLAARTAASEDWDAIVRRGVFLHPRSWGLSAPGTSGDQDLFSVPEAVNAIPPVFSLLPHAGSLVLRPTDASKPHAAKRASRAAWDPKTGHLVVDTPFTQGVAGWSSRKATTFETIGVEVESPYAVVVVSSAGPRTIAEGRRLLVTAVGRAEPTGLEYVDPFRREVADVGRPPMLVEPIRARVTWKKKGTIKAYALEPTGARGKEIRLETTPDGVRLELDGASPTLHWELTEG